MPVKLSSTGGGSVTLTTPSTATDYTATFPANTGNVVTTGSSAVVTPAMLSTGAPSWDGSSNLSFNSGYGSVANAYGCRAWVNFNGDGTIAIRGSAGVASLTDNGTGQYTINLSFTMPDSNYAVVGSAGSTNNAIGDRQLSTYPVNTTSCKVVSGQTASTNVYDATQVHVAIFR